MAHTTHLQKEQFWQSHIIQAKDFNGSINKYCQSHGLQVHSFKYWKNRLSKKSLSSTKPAASSFLPVRVLPSEPLISKKSLPDAKWLAEVIFELHARFQ